ncbi:DNA polymerase III subunit gamma/tau [Halioxenophilus sp. WMMB6]|uniref:DNA polymerase III subunit gamma/tau n=1 Tax=Halioxenophilus sp. WMMB6 TaxID=3073815 RepID=UPI00295E5C21|nr:DNA polymerase III subunit gamma/tau [Halioxenophilus sp. WMMB6]
MSYQVLARKWRPRNFHEMVGQEHVLTALVNALDHNRLHHAYLFTGTRGVGKTTIARIFAKCLNCESGVSSNPCGTCSACVEISEGRFVDLIEVDAASRTKVEDTRELLDNVQYAPTRGRYKVYLIDEVHMLSGHSFNALLKTLEEPPPHVKFLLATTDPQKLPVTILSRCLQFHLKNMSQERIVGHLSHVLGQENLNFEEPALWQLARAADGSMRDALSLTDQAIAFGNGRVTESQVSVMLGAIDQTFIHDMLSALASLDGKRVLAAVAAMAEHSPDYGGALADIIGVLHRVAIAQTVPEALDNSFGDQEQIQQLATTIASEDVQLFYQMALHGRKDLAISPDPRAGFEMTLLRMLAFKPQGVSDLPKAPLPQAEAPATVQSEAASADSAEAKKPQAEPQSPPPVAARSEAPAPVSPEPWGEPVAAPAPIPEPSPPAPAPVAPAVAEPAMAETAPEQPAPVQSTPVPATPVPSTTVQSNPTAATPAHAAMAFGGSDRDEELMAEPAGYGSAEDEYFASAPSDFGQLPAEPESASVAAPEPVPTPNPMVAAPTPERLTAQPLAPQPQSQPPVSPVAAAPIAPAPVAEEPPKAIALEALNRDSWLQLYPQIGAAGVLQSTVSNCVFNGREGDQLHFVLDEANATLYNEDHQARFAELLSNYFDRPLSVAIELGVVDSETPAALAIRLRNERHAQAVSLVRSDPLVQRLVQDFGLEVDPEKIEPTL